MGPTMELANQRLHLLGIGGRGMAPLAIIAQHLGATVDGCDRGGFAANLAALKAAGIPVEPVHSVAHLIRGTSLVATSIAPLEMPEVAVARSEGRLLSRSDLLAAVFRARTGAGITGSHGKGTTTALALGALEAAGLDPLGLVGTPMHDSGEIARIGAGPLIAEVDDSDLSLSVVHPAVAVVTNLDDDHPHLGISLREAVKGVGAFVANASKRVILGPSPRSVELEQFATSPIWKFGRDFSARVVDRKLRITTVEFSLPDGTKVRAPIRLVGPLVHVNAALALATAVALGAEPEAAASGLSSLTRLARRLEHVGTTEGIQIFDDFGGKHPQNVREGLKTLRQYFPDAEIVAVFEPYGPYLNRWGSRYASALNLADHVILLEPQWLADYPSEQHVMKGWDERISVPKHVAASKEEVPSIVKGLVRPGDVIVSFAQIDSSKSIAHSLVDDDRNLAANLNGTR